jgi:hypothetical protein
MTFDRSLAPHFRSAHESRDDGTSSQLSTQRGESRPACSWIELSQEADCLDWSQFGPDGTVSAWPMTR